MKGLLLLNLGTPESPEPPDVRRYLDEFLMDPLVIDIAAPWRFLLVKGIILNTRPKKSAEAYKKIWTDRGSPLLYHSLDLLKLVRERSRDQHVELAMRYGNPSLRSGLEKMRAAGVTELRVIPLYPQYSLAATESSLEKTRTELKRMGWLVNAEAVQDFFDYPPFIKAFAANIKASLDAGPWDHVLLSYHGVPERHVKKTDRTNAHCLATATCCDAIVTANRLCYRAQCYATTRALAAELKLPLDRHSVSFQSRLGRTPWIKPYTDLVLEELARKGVKRLVVACPAFVADCLETLEEIEMRASEDFRRFGGENLRLVPSLNSSSMWADAVAKLGVEAHNLVSVKATSSRNRGEVAQPETAR